jgi:hypothetical protein
MSTGQPDDDDDVRRMIGADSLRTSARSDEAVLSAARAVANERRSRKRNWVPAWAAVAAGVAVAGVALWIGSQRERGTDEPPLSLGAPIVLSAGMVRGGEAPARIELPETAGTVRLVLDLATVVESPRYRAELRSRSGERVWSAEDLEPRTMDWGKAVFVDVESSVLKPGEYELVLQGAAEPGGPDESAYYFEVQRRN